MVEVIIIMDDVYAELYQLKKSKGMSFSKVIRYLLKEARDERKQILSFAGSIDNDDIDRRAIEHMRRERLLVR